MELACHLLVGGCGADSGGGLGQFTVLRGVGALAVQPLGIAAGQVGIFELDRWICADGQALLLAVKAVFPKPALGAVGGNFKVQAAKVGIPGARLVRCAGGCGRNCERLLNTSLQFIHLAFLGLLLRRS